MGLTILPALEGQDCPEPQLRRTEVRTHRLLEFESMNQEPLLPRKRLLAQDFSDEFYACEPESRLRGKRPQRRSENPRLGMPMCREFQLLPPPGCGPDSVDSAPIPAGAIAGGVRRPDVAKAELEVRRFCDWYYMIRLPCIGFAGGRVVVDWLPANPADCSCSQVSPPSRLADAEPALRSFALASRRHFGSSLPRGGPGFCS